MKWKDKLIRETYDALKDDDFWFNYFTSQMEKGAINIHVAIFNEPFLQLMYDNKKTVESRFSINNVVPYNRVFDKDVVLVKRSGGNIEAIFMASNVRFFRNLSAEKIKKLENEFGKQIGWNVDPEFLSNKSSAQFLTLIDISHLQKIQPIRTEKKDKTGWSIIKLGSRNTLFEL